MKKILIVDDELTSRITIARYAEALGCLPVFATSGKRAWHVLEDNPDIRCLITDYAMPDGDGVDLVKKVKSNPEFNNIPIMICSAYTTVQEIKTLLSDGAAAFMAKPLVKSDLQKWIMNNVLVVKV